MIIIMLNNNGKMFYEVIILFACQNNSLQILFLHLHADALLFFCNIFYTSNGS